MYYVKSVSEVLVLKVHLLLTEPETWIIRNYLEIISRIYEIFNITNKSKKVTRYDIQS